MKYSKYFKDRVRKGGVNKILGFFLHRVKKVSVTFGGGVVDTLGTMLYAVSMRFVETAII